MDAQSQAQGNADHPADWSRSGRHTAQTEANTELASLWAFDEESAKLLHELNNVFVSVLLNTQVMEWKLPSYSRLKRNLHEVQRDAQRGGELVKRLLKRFQGASYRELSVEDSETRTSPTSMVNCAATNPETGTANRPEDTTIKRQQCPTPVFSAPGKKVPHTPV